MVRVNLSCSIETKILQKPLPFCPHQHIPTPALQSCGSWWGEGAVSSCECMYCMRMWFTVCLSVSVLSVQAGHVCVRMSEWGVDLLMRVYESDAEPYVGGRLLFLYFSICLCLFFYLSWPGHVQIPTIQQFWRVDCINLNNGSLFPFLSHPQPRRWLQADTHYGDSRPPWGWW